MMSARDDTRSILQEVSHPLEVKKREDEGGNLDQFDVKEPWFGQYVV